MSEFFFIVGAQRCGTTYLYHLLDQHPDIEMARPIRPEPKFFLQAELYSQGLKAYEQFYFDKDSHARIRGEKSTSYIENGIVAERIIKMLPQARIVLLLREPIARAVSNYHFSVQNGLEDWSLGDAFFKEDEREHTNCDSIISVSPFAYLRRGRYIEYIERYLEHIPRAQLHIMLYEDLITSTKAISKLFNFLNADTLFMPQGINDVVNASHPQNVIIDSRLKNYLNKYFAEPNQRLSEFLGDDLDQWR